MTFLDQLFYFPRLVDPGYWWKLLALGGIAILTGWLLTIVLLKTAYRRSRFPCRDLDILMARFWSAIVVFILVQLYGVLVLNWFLGGSDRTQFEDLSFYLRFGPEWIVSASLGTLIGFLRSQILESTRPAK